MLKELVEIDVECRDKSCVNAGHPHEIRHRLVYVNDERGLIKFRHRDNGKFYYQGPGPIWYEEKES